ncbi:MAG: TIGR02391 family protein [Mycetocola sp.]
MEATKNPEYLRSVIERVAEFRDALTKFLELHEINTFARGMMPAVFPRDRVDQEDLDAATLKVDVASGRARAAPGLTNVYYGVQGHSTAVDPIAVWHTITQPKPVLEPSNILSAVGQITGRLEAMLAEAEADAPPAVGAQAMHPLIWSAASRLWRDRHFRQAVSSAAEALVANVKSLTGRNDVAETSLWQQVFSAAPPTKTQPRLRWPGNPADRDVSAMNDGLRMFAPGVQMTIRNGATHGISEMREQDAIERLAALSLLARWVDECELITHPADS